MPGKLHEAQCRPPESFAMPLRLLHDRRLQALRVLDIDSLHIAVELLLGVLLVVSSPRDTDPDPVRAALDTRLPNLLVQLRIDSDVGGSLGDGFVSNETLATAPSPCVPSLPCGRNRVGRCQPYHCLLRKLLDLLDGMRSPLLEGDAMQLFSPLAPPRPISTGVPANVRACEGGWCTLERRHRQWPTAAA